MLYAEGIVISSCASLWATWNHCIIKLNICIYHFCMWWTTERIAVVSLAFFFSPLTSFRSNNLSVFEGSNLCVCSIDMFTFVSVWPSRNCALFSVVLLMFEVNRYASNSARLQSVILSCLSSLLLVYPCKDKCFWICYAYKFPCQVCIIT